MIRKLDTMKKSQLRKMLYRSDAEFLLEEVSRGRYKIRVGQLWQMPRLRGTSTLLLDYDNCKRINVRNIRRRLGQCQVFALRIRSCTSPGGAGIHVVVRIKGAYSPMALVALQAICESDPSREAQNFKRAFLAEKKWGKHWNVLFKKGEL